MKMLKKIRLAYYDKNSQSYSYYRCICGNIKIIRDNVVKYGTTRSCGCYKYQINKQTGKKANAYKHGHRIKKQFTREYRSWSNMKSRCYNPFYTNFKYWGGKGIKVCKRWHDFSNFLMDMGERPNNMSLERIDGNEDYKPSNCIWANRKRQSQNRIFNLK